MKAMAGIRTDHLTHQALTSAFRATGDLRQGLLPYTEYSQIKAVSIWKKNNPKTWIIPEPCSKKDRRAQATHGKQTKLCTQQDLKSPKPTKMLQKSTDKLVRGQTHRLDWCPPMCSWLLALPFTVSRFGPLKLRLHRGSHRQARELKEGLILASGEHSGRGRSSPLRHKPSCNSQDPCLIHETACVPSLA